MAFRIAAKDHKMSQIDFCMVCVGVSVVGQLAEIDPLNFSLLF